MMIYGFYSTRTSYYLLASSCLGFFLGTVADLFLLALSFEGLNDRLFYSSFYGSKVMSFLSSELLLVSSLLSIARGVVASELILFA